MRSAAVGALFHGKLWGRLLLVLAFVIDGRVPLGHPEHDFHGPKLSGQPADHRRRGNLIRGTRVSASAAFLPLGIIGYSPWPLSEAILGRFSGATDEL